MILHLLEEDSKYSLRIVAIVMELFLKNMTLFWIKLILNQNQQYFYTIQSIVSLFSINPAHHHFKQYYYQEWDDRDRLIHDRIYPPYYSQEEAKNANGGVWPTDFSKIKLRPGGLNYIYNILTGYHYNPPKGLDVPKGKHFNPYFDHMIIGMPR